MAPVMTLRACAAVLADCAAPPRSRRSCLHGAPDDGPVIVGVRCLECIGVLGAAACEVLFRRRQHQVHQGGGDRSLGVAD